MKILAPIALCLLYLVAVVGFAASPWVNAIFSFFFLFAYWWVVKEKLSVPLAMVLFGTLVFPVAVLFAIGMPTYHSWFNTAGAIFSSLRDHGQFWGLELLAPLLAAAVAALILRRRSNIAVKRDALQARPLP